MDREDCGDYDHRRVDNSAPADDSPEVGSVAVVHRKSARLLHRRRRERRVWSCFSDVLSSGFIRSCASPRSELS